MKKESLLSQKWLCKLLEDTPTQTPNPPSCFEKKPSYLFVHQHLVLNSSKCRVILFNLCWLISCKMNLYLNFFFCWNNLLTN